MRSRLPGLALLGVLTVTGAGALAQAEAERRLDAAIERLRGALGPDTRLEIGGRQVDPVTGRAMLSDVVVTQGANRITVPELHLSELAETRVGRAEARRVSYQEGNASTGEVARVLVAGLPIPASGKSLDVFNLAFEAVEVEALRLQHSTRGTLRLDRLEVRDWRPEGIASGRLEGFDFRNSQPEQVMRLGRIELAALTLPFTNRTFDPKAFRAERIAVEGAELRDAVQNVSLGLARLSLTDWIPGRLSALALDGISLTSPASTYGVIEMRLARMAAEGIDGAGMLAAVLNEVQVPDPQAGATQRFVMEGLDASWDGQPVTAIARVASEGILRDGLASGGVTVEGIRVTPPRGQADWLDGLGYREIAGEIESRMTLPRAGGRLEVAPVRVTWTEAGTLGLVAQVDDMPGGPAPGAPIDQADMIARLAAAKLAGVTLTWRDSGLLGRVIAMQARQQRVPEARLREQWAQMALGMPIPGAPPPSAQPGRRGAPPAGGKGGAADPFAPMREAVAAFIRQPGTLEVSLSPAKPIAFADMAALGGDPPAQTVQRLGLSVTAR